LCIDPASRVEALGYRVVWAGGRGFGDRSRGGMGILRMLDMLGNRLLDMLGNRLLELMGLSLSQTEFERLDMCISPSCSVMIVCRQ
jgi:hypothetical protein